MRPFEFVLAIIVIALAYHGFKEFLAYRQKARASASESDEAEVLRSRIHELEERIRVLERIVTDEKQTLRDQFREL